MTKTLATFIRTLSVAALLAALALSLAGSAAQAEPNTGKTPSQLACEAGGYEWVAGQGCANKICRTSDGGSYLHGEVREVEVTELDAPWPPGSLVTCDGVTGRWTFAIVRPKPPVSGPIRGQATQLPVLQHALPSGPTAGVAPPLGGAVSAPR